MKAGLHVRKRGEEIRSGHIVIPAGTLLRPQEIGLIRMAPETSYTAGDEVEVLLLDREFEMGEPLQCS